MLYPSLIASIESLKVPSEERKIILQPLINYLKEKISASELIRLNFICTHNSRRSHLAQIWAQALAKYHGVPKVITYSGGTEATQIYPKIIETIMDQGFEVRQLSQESNPIYAIKYADNQHPVIGFSKAYDDSFNPIGQFAAIMTCSQADQGCPFVAGTEKRIAVTYEDPKVSDGSLQEDHCYAQKSLEIASEMNYVMLQSRQIY